MWDAECYAIWRLSAANPYRNLLAAFSWLAGASTRRGGATAFGRARASPSPRWFARHRRRDSTAEPLV